MSIDAVSSLPLLRWRGLAAPCIESPWEGGHEQAPRAYPYVDAEGHDNTGRRSYVVRANLAFNNTIEADLFPDRLRQWVAALEDGSAGRLEHPVLGTFDARVLAWAGTLSAQDRGGVTLSVTWTETMLDPTEPSTFATANISAQAVARAADESMAALGVPFPSGLEWSSLADAIASLEGEFFSASLTFRGQLARVEGLVGSLLDTADARLDVASWPLVDQLEALQAHLQERAAKVTTRTRKTARTVTTAQVSLDVFAASVGNSFEDVLALNLDKLRSPLVPRGSTLVYYV